MNFERKRKWKRWVCKNRLNGECVAASYFCPSTLWWRSSPFFVSMIHLVGRHCLFAISLRAIPPSHKEGVWVVVEGLRSFFHAVSDGSYAVCRLLSVSRSAADGLCFGVMYDGGVFSVTRQPGACRRRCCLLSLFVLRSCLCDVWSCYDVMSLCHDNVFWILLFLPFLNHLFWLIDCLLICNYLWNSEFFEKYGTSTM